ncbi:putative nadh-ubiquinone oxidoreductase 21kda subunit [Erysiphe necator]|uniref:NADH dehydrogenase [ubiquinone] iron-sulfur protein 4, mitochondrial n=1 Tax=Uncinula necator TaxID=52586 RepID=A0A0B1PCD7_UNCNE|nr:putative nadh-ubiquinone oxidoreductase 21kda subunit [Erysiphe necator]
MSGSQLQNVLLRHCPAILRYQKLITKAAICNITTDSYPTAHDVSIRSQPEAVDNKKIQVGKGQPLYSAEVDQASSPFSPIPKRPNGINQQGDIIPAAVVSGVPVEIQSRTVRIYRPAKPATQSGNWYGDRWRMDWDILSKGHRWENPLMGWQSSGDFMQATHMTFKTKEEAIQFAENQGYEYIVHEPNTRKITPKAYANNFLWSDKKLKHVRTK